MSTTERYHTSDKSSEFLVEHGVLEDLIEQSVDNQAFLLGTIIESNFFSIGDESLVGSSVVTFQLTFSGS